MSAHEFDLTRFLDGYADSPEILHEILALYATEAPERIDALAQALGSRDHAKISRAAHSLANTGGTLHASAVVDLARATEAAARAADTDACARIVPQLIVAVRAVIDSVESYRSVEG